MAYFLIVVLGGTLLWLMRSYLAEEDNDYYRHSPGERAAHSIGLGFVTAAAIWGITALLVRNVWVDSNFKKVVVAEMDTYKLVETKSGDRIVIADDGKTAYEVEDLSVSDFGDSDAKLRLYRYEANSWLGTQYQGWVEDHLYGEFPGHK